MNNNNMFGKKKLKLCEADGTKIDTAIITSVKDTEAIIKRWKKKGLM